MTLAIRGGSQCESTTAVEQGRSKDAKTPTARRPCAGNAGMSGQGKPKLRPLIDKVQRELRVIDKLDPRDFNRFGDHLIKLSAALRTLENSAAEADAVTIDVSEAVLCGTNYKPETVSRYVQMVSDHQLAQAAHDLDAVNTGFQQARKTHPEIYESEVEATIEAASEAVVGSWEDEGVNPQDKTPTAQVFRLVQLLDAFKLDSEDTSDCRKPALSDKLFGALMNRCVLKITGSTNPADVKKLKNIILNDPTLNKPEFQNRRINAWLNKHSVPA